MTIDSETFSPQFQRTMAGCLWPAIVGILTFFGTLVLGLVVTILVIRSIPPEVPNPTEAYEGFGDAMMAILRIYFGAMVSFMAAVFVSIMVIVRVGKGSRA